MFWKGIIITCCCLVFLHLHQGEGQKNLFPGTRPKQKTTTAEQLTYTQQTEQNACCPRQGRSALLSDGQMHGKVLFGRNRNAISVLPVVTGSGSMCSRVYNWWQVSVFAVYACCSNGNSLSMDQLHAQAQSAWPMQLKVPQQIQTRSIDHSCVLPTGWESTAKGLANGEKRTRECKHRRIWAGALVEMRLEHYLLFFNSSWFPMEWNIPLECQCAECFSAHWQKTMWQKQRNIRFSYTDIG